MLLDLVCFVENFSFVFGRDIGLSFSFLVMSLPGFGIRVILSSYNELGGVYLSDFL